MEAVYCQCFMYELDVILFLDLCDALLHAQKWPIVGWKLVLSRKLG